MKSCSVTIPPADNKPALPSKGSVRTLNDTGNRRCLLVIAHTDGVGPHRSAREKVTNVTFVIASRADGEDTLVGNKRLE